MNHYVRSHKFSLRSLGLVLAISLGLLTAACGGDDGDDEAAATTAADSADSGRSHRDASSEELATWQEDLNAVGCWAGPVDGELGPETEAAIKDFQAAAGLTVDGLLGAQTEGALTDAVRAGETVCAPVERSSTTGTSGDGSASPEIESFEVEDVRCDTGEEGIAQASWQTANADVVAFSVDGGAVTADAGQPTSTDDGRIGQVPCDGDEHQITLTASAGGDSATKSVTVRSGTAGS